MESDADNMLMQEVKADRLERLGDLYERHYATLFSYFVRLTHRRAASEDLVQEVFLKILRYRHSFAANGRFRPWMYQIARNLLYDHLRKSRPDTILEWEDWQEQTEDPSGLSPDQALHRQENYEMLQEALFRMPVEKREVLTLSRYQNLKYTEIAAIMNCEVGAVKVRVFRALQELKSIYLNLTGERSHE